MGRLFGFMLSLVLALTVSSFADDNAFYFGGDVFGGNESVNISQNVANDVFTIGNNVNITGVVSGDIHAVGTNVLVQRNVRGNVYAGGNSVQIFGSIGRDVLAAGNNVTIGGAEVGGNVRAMGRSVTIESAVLGNVLIGAKNATLNGTVQGDFTFGGENLVFGNNAKIEGSVNLKGPIDFAVPASVASADRVTIIQASAHNMSYGFGGAAREMFENVVPNFVVPIIAFLVGIIWLALMPDRSTMAYLVSQDKPFKSIFVGVLGLSMFFGLMLVLGLTLVGIPLIPIALVLLVLAWVVGYVGGAYFLGARILEAFGQRIESLGFQAVALVLGLILAWTLSMVPFVGWAGQIALICFGLGAMGLAMIYRRAGSPYHTQLHDQLRSN